MCLLRYMNKRLTTDMADANEITKSYKTYRIFQHQEIGRRFLQRAMQYNIQFNIQTPKTGLENEAQRRVVC